MPRLSTDYDRPLVEASRSALLELAISLGAYRDALVLVGGWWTRSWGDGVIKLSCTVCTELYRTYLGIDVVRYPTT